MMRRFLSFFKIGRSLGINLGYLRVKCQPDVAINGGYRCTHFMAGRRNEFVTLALISLLVSDIAENHYRPTGLAGFTKYRRSHEGQSHLVLGAVQQHHVVARNTLLFSSGQEYRFSVLSQWLAGF